MPRNNPDTETLQHWMKTVLTTGGNLPQKIAFAGQQFGWNLTELVEETATVPAETRIGIYTTGYMLRLLECMQADLPSLHAWLGEELFVVFAKGYLLTHPSHSYSLFELTAGFADFLEQTRPRHPDMDARQHAQYDLPAELVRIERARLAAMRSPGTETIAGTAAVADIFRFFSGEMVTVQAHSCLQLLAQKMPLADFYHSLMRGIRPEIPLPEPAFLAVSRMHYRLKITPLQAWQFHLLHALRQQGEPAAVSQLVQEVAAHTVHSPGELLASMNLWLPHAVEAGLLIAS